MFCLFSMFMTYSTFSCHFGKLFNPWNLCVSLQSYSKLVIGNKIIDNFEDFSLLLFSHRFVLLLKIYFHRELTLQCKVWDTMPSYFFISAGYYWIFEAWFLLYIYLK
jgi:hypothetical protein